MLSNTLLTATIKNGATNEEIYELVRLIWGESMKKTYYSLLKNDKYYQSLLTETDAAERELNQQQISPEVKSSIERFINLSEEMEDESQSMLYLAAFIDSYLFFKTLGLVNCKRLNFRYDRKNPRLLSSSRSTLTIHI